MEMWGSAHECQLVATNTIMVEQLQLVVYMICQSIATITIIGRTYAISSVHELSIGWHHYYYW